jgi:hypothetical protein
VEAWPLTAFTKKWPAAIAIASQVLSNAPASLSLGMIAFSDKRLARVDVGPPAPNEIASRMQKYAGMRPAGGTALLDTIDRAIGMFTPSHVADAIYVISDAGANYSKGTIDRVRTRLLVSGVRLHLIYIRETAIAFSRAPLTAIERKTARYFQLPFFWRQARQIFDTGVRLWRLGT